jgi:hypothetical protein
MFFAIENASLFMMEFDSDQLPTQFCLSKYPILQESLVGIPLGDSRFGQLSGRRCPR